MVTIFDVINCGKKVFIIPPTLEWQQPGYQVGYVISALHLTSSTPEEV